MPQVITVPQRNSNYVQQPKGDWIYSVKVKGAAKKTDETTANVDPTGIHNKGAVNTPSPRGFLSIPQRVPMHQQFLPSSSKTICSDSWVQFSWRTLDTEATMSCLEPE